MHATDRVAVQVEDDLPVVCTDAGLVERALANLVENALRHTRDTPVLVTASAVPDRLEIRVVDRGPRDPRRREGRDVRALPTAR